MSRSYTFYIYGAHLNARSYTLLYIYRFFAAFLP